MNAAPDNNVPRETGASPFAPLPPLDNLRVRDRMVSAMRDWFHSQGFFEVETPVRIPSPAPELFIDCPPSGTAFLRASPELQMKRLLAGGADRIFQIGPCFRDGERGSRHNPEFTMLEWYRRDASYMDILDDCMALVCQTTVAATGSATIVRDCHAIDLDGDWETIPVRDAYRRWAGWDPVVAWDAERFDVDMAERVEPSLPKDRAVVLIDYPREAASLSRVKPSDSAVAERWELYIGGMELANAFGELTDGREMRRRFEEARAKRAALGEADYGLDEDFLADLESGTYPESGGIALGIDRLAMLLCGAESIDEVRPFCPPLGGCWR